MTATRLDGKATLAAIKEELKVRVKARADAGRTPGLGTVLHAGIVTGGDIVGLKLLAVRPELAELQPIVADHTRIRRASR